jgi:Protein of unknown function (DUF2510)
VTDTLGRALVATCDIEGFLTAEADADAENRFTELEHAVADLLTVSFRGHAPLHAQPHGQLTFTKAVSAATITALSERFDLATQQSKGAWWLPEDALIRSGFVNLPAHYATHPAWAMNLCADDHGRFPLTNSPAGFAAWAILAAFAADVLEPLTLRGPDNGTLDPSAAATRWEAVLDRYTGLGLATAEVLAALDAMRQGRGWSRLDAAGQQAARQNLVATLAAAVSAEAVKRWRVGPLRELITRYYAKSKKGPAEARAVLVKAVQPPLAAFFGGDWLAFLYYLGERPADGETILTSLPEARLYVEASAKVKQVAAEQNLSVAEVSRMLASYLGGDAVVSPVQRRVDVIRSYWQAADGAQARQAPGMPALRSLADSQVPSPDKPENPFGDEPPNQWLPSDLQRDIDLLWGGMVFPPKPDRIVSTLSPYWSLQQALDPALQFWHEISLSCWYICEGPWARTDLSGLREYYSRQLAALTRSGTPVDEALFADLTAAERRLGPVEQVQHEPKAVDAGHGISISLSMGSGTRRRGFEILRDIVTAHRRAWAATHLEAAIRSAWEVPLRDLAEDVNRAIAARGKLPTTRQFAGMAAKVANTWFCGDLSATFAAIGEKPVIEQTRIRLLPLDRYQFCRRVFTDLGGRPVHDYKDPLYSQVYTLLSLAANAPRLLQKQELLDREPTAKEAGYETYQNWPDGLDYRRYLDATTHARQGLSVTPDSPQSVDVPETVKHAAETAAPRAAASTKESAATQPSQSGEAAAAAGPAAPAGWYPDINHAGVLRWWTGTAWTALTAPGQGADAGWFTDPNRSDELRWWDGTAWTTHLTPAQAPARPAAASTGRQSLVAATDYLPPWEVRGLPCGLTDADFALARRVAWQLNTVQVAGDRTFEPATGSWARYFNAAGVTYPENIARLRHLLTREPIARTDEGWAVYPAILIPDPSTSQTSTVPVGACSEVGYIGSAWCSLATSWARRIQEWLPQRRYAVTRLAVSPEVSEYSASAKVWIPTLDLPPWHRDQET